MLMRKPLLRKTAALLFVSTLVVPFQNCSPIKGMGFQGSNLDISSTSTSPLSQYVTNGTKTVFACDPSMSRSNSILKLSNREFALALSNLLNDFSPNISAPLSLDPELLGLVAALPNDISLAEFTSQENSFLLTTKTVSGFFGATYRAAVLVSTAGTGLTNYPNTGGCLASTTITQTCHQTLVRELASRAFRRTLSVTEGNQLAASIWSSILAKADLLLDTFATIASYPDFIYKAYNMGPDSPASPRTTNIAGLELANKLSFFLTGAPADATLRAIAAAGGLENPTTFSSEFDRLISSPAGEAGLQRLFREFYGYDISSDLQYGPTFLNGASTTNLKTAMVQEMDYFFVNEVLTSRAKFQDLMTSRNSRVANAALGQIYGVAASGTAGTTLPADRPGFLTRAAFLTKKSGYYTSPVKRGRHVMERVLCEFVGDPPANAPTSVSEVQTVGQLVSTRTRYENLTMQPNTSCVSCHSKVNPYGFALEGFDTLGRRRNVESIFNTTSGLQLGDVPVNTETSVHLNFIEPVTRVFDATDMATGLASSDLATMCFAKHLKEFDARQAPSNPDFCHMNEVLNVLYGTNGTQGTVYEAIKAYVTANAFRVWKY